MHTHLSYGIIIWGSTYKSHLERLSSLQNKAIRAVGGAEWNESSSPLYYKFKVLKFYDIYKYELAKFMIFINMNFYKYNIMNFASSCTKQNSTYTFSEFF